jgi:hypothetical protein
MTIQNSNKNKTRDWRKPRPILESLVHNSQPFIHHSFSRFTIIVRLLNYTYMHAAESELSCCFTETSPNCVHIYVHIKMMDDFNKTTETKKLEN